MVRDSRLNEVIEVEEFHLPPRSRQDATNTRASDKAVCSNTQKIEQLGDIMLLHRGPEHYFKPVCYKGHQRKADTKPGFHKQAVDSY